MFRFQNYYTETNVSLFASRKYYENKTIDFALTAKIYFTANLLRRKHSTFITWKTPIHDPKEKWHLQFTDWKSQYCKNVAVHTAISGLSTLPIELSMTFFTEQHKSILNFVWNHSSSRIARNTLIKSRIKVTF